MSLEEEQLTRKCIQYIRLILVSGVAYETPQREINLKRMTRNLAFLLNFGRRVGHNHRLEKQDREEGKKWEGYVAT